MTDEIHFVAVFRVELFLEREEDDHLIHDLFDQFDSGRLPRPDLGTHVINDLDTEGFKFPGQAQIETGVINEDNRIGMFFSGVGYGQVKDAFDTAIMTDDLRETDDGQLCDVGDQSTPSFLE